MNIGKLPEHATKHLLSATAGERDKLIIRRLTGSAEELFLICKPGSIDKTRWIVPAGERCFEVDEFHGENEGLVMAEIELESQDEAFERPSWLGEEVTGDPRFYNGYLARNPFKNW